MTIPTYILVATFVAGVGTLLDKIVSSSHKKAFTESILRLNSRNITEYVTSNTLAVYKRVFSAKFYSCKFFIRSAIFTFILISLSLLYLASVFPATAINATSYIRSAFLGNFSFVPVLIPLLIAVFADYFCNGITKYFLELMNNEKKITRFTILGYAELSTTTIIAVVSICFSILAFQWLHVRTSEETVSIDLKFSQTKESFNSDAELFYSNFEVLPSEYDRRMIQREVDLASDYPKLGRFNIGVEQAAEGPILFFRNDSDVNESYLRLSSTEKYFVFSRDALPESWEEYCSNFSNAPDHRKFLLLLKDGWDRNLINDSCVNGNDLVISPTVSWKNSVIDYGMIFSNAIGEFVQLTIYSFFENFGRYIHFSPSTEFKVSFFTGDKAVAEDFASSSLESAYKFRLGESRFFDTSNFPFNTIFVATILTSLSIWLAIISTFLLFPAAFMLSKLNDDNEKKHVLRIDNYPFTITFSIFCLYLAIISIVISIF